LGLRLAEPGEFTQRAFLNGKLDLAQAESVADLIDASTEAAVRSAARSLGGVFSQRVQQLRDRLVRLRMLVEATLDFPEEDIDFLHRPAPRCSCAAAMRSAPCSTARSRARCCDGLRVVLAGQPNVGSKPLLNALAGAGWRSSADRRHHATASRRRSVEERALACHRHCRLRRPGNVKSSSIGIAQRWESIAAAVSCCCCDPRVAARTTTRPHKHRSPRNCRPRPTATLQTKSDLVDPLAAPPDAALCVCAPSGQGLEPLRQACCSAPAGTPCPGPVPRAYAPRARCSARVEHLQRAQALGAGAGTALELLARELRRAHDALGRDHRRLQRGRSARQDLQPLCIGK
jgi:tRNA modification GTPase